MRMYDIILKKRNGEALNSAEIGFFIKGYTDGSIPDYQASALLMAIYFRGMNKEETATLTQAMVNSGSVLDLSGIEGIKVDKHSTGGVGDKTTLVLGPLVASAGAKVAKMSGRGLGHTGGTIDKLESIEGFNVSLTMDQFIKNVNETGIAVAGQTGDLAPADKKLYALRDVTATVDNLSLIAGSIMSKKIASGADAIVLDVKTGSGAFMKTVDDSFLLGKEMVDIGTNLGRSVTAFVTEMNEPLGYGIGNALEVLEAIDTLKGKGPADLTQLSLELGAAMVVLAEKATDHDAAVQLLKENIRNGSAFEKFVEMVEAQGGNGDQVRNPDLLPKAKNHILVEAHENGYITTIDAESIGIAALMMGAGRETKESNIDFSVGIVLNKKVGEKVSIGDTLAVMHINDMSKVEECTKKIQEAYIFTEKEPEKRPLIFGKVTKDGILRTPIYISEE